MNIFIKSILFWVLSTSGAFCQTLPGSPEYRKNYVGSSLFVLANLFPDPPSFYQLNVGRRVTSKDVLSVEFVTWRYHSPLGIPYGESFGSEDEKYPGSIREYGAGFVYQRFLWKNLYSSVQTLPLLRKYLDADGQRIQYGFQLFFTGRIGYHVEVAGNRFFLEPSLACTFWPVTTNVPASFAERDRKWPNYFLFEPGLHFGFKF